MKIINRSFPVAVDLGCWDGALEDRLKMRSDIKTLYECDGSCFPLLRV